MRKVLLTLMLGAVVVAGCGDDKKSTTQKKSYVIDKQQALKVTRLAMRTAALVGRHAAIPGGISLGGAAPTCPLSGVEDAINIEPTCTPDLTVDGKVVCTFVETYTCPEATGKLTNDVTLLADGFDFSLAAADYQEGTTSTGFIKYNGDVDVTMTADGDVNYKDGFNVVARAESDTVDTLVTSTSDVTVSTDSGVVLNGLADLVISGSVDGQGKVNMQNLDFAGCDVSPKAGVIALALVGIEKAEIEFNGCGDATLYHFENGARANPETFTADELSYGFAQSVSDIANFANAASNTTPSATALAGNTFCAPVVPGAVALLAASVTKPVGVAPFDGAGISNPFLECLAYPEGATSFVHMVWEDTTGEGTFSDPTKVLVHFFEAGGFAPDSSAVGGKNLLIYAQYAPALTTGAQPLASLALDANGMPTAANLSPFCDPTPPTSGGPMPTDPTFCWSRIAFDEGFDHLGLRVTNAANVGKQMGSGGAAPAEPISGGFWYIHILE